MLLNSILDAIGRTPLIKLNRLGAHLECNLYAKCEFLNPGGSVKDRIGLSMVDAAEKEGRIKPGDTLIEPTSGNTGIGIALAGAVRGYRVIITMPEKMSREKQVVLEALGAEIIRTPTEAAFDSPESHISVARRLQSQLPNAHILDQYGNPHNPKVHYDTTAQEILDDLDGQVDMVVIGAGTGGTITGVAKRMKEVRPSCRIVGADPVGSILGGGTRCRHVQGRGDRLRLHSRRARQGVGRRVGQDLGPAVVPARAPADSGGGPARRRVERFGDVRGAAEGRLRCGTGQNCVVLLADGVRNYMTKFVDDKWMRDNGFFQTRTIDARVGDICSTEASTRPPLVLAEDTQTLEQVVQVMRTRGISQLPVTSGGVLVGMVSEADVMAFFGSGEGTAQALVSKVMNRYVPVVGAQTPISTLEETLRKSSAVVVVDEHRHPISILTRIDLLHFLLEREHAPA